MHEIKRRALNIIIGFDQFIQVIVYVGNYTPDETISGIIGRKMSKGEANVVEHGICFMLRKLQAKHCIRSIDSEEDLSKGYTND